MMYTATTHPNIFHLQAHPELHTEHIIRLEASGGYTIVYLTHGRKIILCKVLKVFSELLIPLGFVRTHRTHLVNPQYINCIKPNDRIVMTDASEAAISRRLRKDVLNELGTEVRQTA